MSACSPYSPFYRYIILFLICYMKFALFFCIEMPSGLQNTLVNVFKIDAKQYNILFSSLTWADVILSVIGGLLIDKVIGIRRGALLFSVIAVLGKLVFIAGAIYGDSYGYVFLVTGRFLFGLGVGPLNNVLNVFLALWFKGKVTLAMSMTFCTCRIGASLGLVLPQLIYETTNVFSHDNRFRVGCTFVFGLVFLVVSLVSCVAVVLLDNSGVNNIKRKLMTSKRFDLENLKDFSIKFWLAVISCTMFYAVLFVFVANGQVYYISKFGLTTRQANIVNFLVFAAPVFATPLFGLLIQSVGYNVGWGIAGSMLAMFSHILFNITEEQKGLPYLCTVLFSISYSFFGISIYPIPAFIVQEHQLATAYGLYNTIYSISMTVVSVASGTIVDYAGYMWLEIYFVLLLFSIFVMMIVLGVVDMFSKDKKVNVPATWAKAAIAFCQKRRNQEKKRDFLHSYYSDEFEYLMQASNDFTKIIPRS